MECNRDERHIRFAEENSAQDHQAGAYRNETGLSKWFVSSERYVAAHGMPYPPVGDPQVM